MQLTHDTRRPAPEPVAATLEVHAVKAPRTLADYAALREQVDFDQLLADWRNGNRKHVADLLGTLGDMAVACRFAVCLARHVSLDASNAFADLAQAAHDQAHPSA